MNFIIPVFEYLNNIYRSCFNDFVDAQKNTEQIKFIVLMVLLSLILFIVWLPYLSQVKEKIWRVKGMLNMIPMDIIGNNENLKISLISDDIAAAVK